jgi:hypothetical protein
MSVLSNHHPEGLDALLRAWPPRWGRARSEAAFVSFAASAALARLLAPRPRPQQIGISLGRVPCPMVLQL